MSHPTNFRVWSKQSFKWMNNIVISAQGTPILMYSEKVDDRVFHRVFLIDNYEPVVQMSTGLKDKNGVEIFEGDVINGFHGDSDEVLFTGTVEWSDGQFNVSYTEKPADWQGVSTVLGRGYTHQVIDTVVEKSARAAQEAAVTAAEKAAKPQIVT